MTKPNTILQRLFASRVGAIRTAIGLAIVLFLALNVIVADTLRSARADLTENHLYSLSDGTTKLLAGLHEPITFRLFLSEDLVRSAPQLAAYADRVRSMLETYASVSKGKIVLQVINPKPYSDEEDRAVGFGLQRIALAGAENQMFFGLAATNSTDGRALIPVFSPDRESFLEYDLTRLVAKLGEPKKPVVALIDGLGLDNPATGETQTLTQLREIYDVHMLSGDIDALPKNTKVVLAVHPQKLSDRTLYTLDQWVLGGGGTMIFVDPNAETATPMQPGMPPANPSSSLPKLFDAWGVGFDATKAVADPTYAIRTTREVEGREMEAANPAWLAIRPDGMDRDDASLSQLSSLILTSAGAFTTSRPDVTLTPLLTASPKAGLVPATDVASPWQDPRGLLAGLKPSAKRLVIAGRLGGALKTAFPKGKPQGSKAEGPPRSVLAGKANVLLVGDADMLSDRNWIRSRQVLGQSIAEPFANNGDFLMNAVEQMAGGAALADLRGKAVDWRPFDRIDALKQAAEDRYLKTEQALVTKVHDAESKLRDLTPADAKDGQPLSPETLKAADDYRLELLRARAQLRDVQYQLGRNVESLRTWITAVNVAGTPIVVAIGALALAFRRSRRPVPRKLAA